MMGIGYVVAVDQDGQFYVVRIVEEVRIGPFPNAEEAEAARLDLEAEVSHERHH